MKFKKILNRSLYWSAVACLCIGIINALKENKKIYAFSHHLDIHHIPEDRKKLSEKLIMAAEEYHKEAKFKKSQEEARKKTEEIKKQTEEIRRRRAEYNAETKRLEREWKKEQDMKEKNKR